MLAACPKPLFPPSAVNAFASVWTSSWSGIMMCGRPIGRALLEHCYEPPFKFTGKIGKLTVRLEPVQ